MTRSSFLNTRGFFNRVRQAHPEGSMPAVPVLADYVVDAHTLQERQVDVDGDVACVLQRFRRLELPSRRS